MLRAAYQASDGLVLPLQATGTSGMETGLVSLLEPGDEVIIGVSGFFGERMVEIARRHGADVIEVRAELGEHVPNERLLTALDDHPEARLMAVVHAETSTGVEHPLADLGAAMRGGDTLLMADCVTSLGGVELDFDGWGIDYAYSCTQKCLGAPPGMSPVAVSERALERIRRRDAGSVWLRPAGTRALLGDAPVRLSPHGADPAHLRAPRGAAPAGHRRAGCPLAPARSRGALTSRTPCTVRALELLADPRHQLAPLTAVRVPEGVEGKQVQRRLLDDHGIEIGGGLGPTAPPIWRIGLMGENADRRSPSGCSRPWTRCWTTSPCWPRWRRPRPQAPGIGERAKARWAARDAEKSMNAVTSGAADRPRSERHTTRAGQPAPRVDGGQHAELEFELDRKPRLQRDPQP